MVLNFERNICEVVAKVKVESASSIVCTSLGYNNNKQAWAEKCLVSGIVIFVLFS